MGLKVIKEAIDVIQFEELNKQITETVTNLEENMCGLQHRYDDLKELFLQRPTQHYILDSKLVEKWNLLDMVLRYSPWTSMIFMLNHVAVDNISNLFPTDWQTKPPPSYVQEKHFKILTEVMTEMFIH